MHNFEVMVTVTEIPRGGIIDKPSNHVGRGFSPDALEMPGMV